MWQILRYYGVSPKIVKPNISVYQRSKSRVRVGPQISDSFTVHSGVLQGDTLALFLFIVVLDLVLFKWIDLREFGVTLCDHDQTYIPGLDSADEIAHLDRDVEKAERHSTELITEARNVGLNVNFRKTKYITLNLHDVADTQQTLDGNMIERVEDFKYQKARVISLRTDLIRRGVSFGSWTKSGVRPN